MAAKKNIYKIDGIFITVGLLFTFVFGIGLLSDSRTYGEYVVHKDHLEFSVDGQGRTKEEIKEAYSADEVFGGFPYFKLISLINGVLILGVGMYYRRKEKKIIMIWDALDRTGEAKINDLIVSLGIPRDFILTHLRLINSQRNVYYVYDSDSDKIVDGKLRAEYVFVTACQGCGHTLDVKIALSSVHVPKCSYCGHPVSTHESINAKREQILMNRPDLQDEKKPVNWFVFALLVFVFWPAAIFYVYMRKR